MLSLIVSGMSRQASKQADEGSPHYRLEKSIQADTMATGPVLEYPKPS